MVNPSHPGNVGSAARAIKTMGFSELVLVAPYRGRDPAPGGRGPVQRRRRRAGERPRLRHAGRGAGPGDAGLRADGAGARPGPPPCDIRQAADLACAHLGQAAEGVAAIVLGTEKSGLTNAQIALCHRICHIPANPQYSSLNVAQALQLAAWELRYALLIDQGAALLPVSTAQEPRAARNRPPAKRCRPSWLIGNRRWSRYVSWTPSTPRS